MIQKLLIFLFFITAALATIPANAEEIPVLLVLNKQAQTDSMGCNFVEQVTDLVYKEIIAGRVKLWDSQQKEIPIGGSTLQEIERNAGVRFQDQETIFIYEMWEITRKEIVTRALGMTFAGKSATGEEVAYGYVDYRDLKELFMSTRINANASGVYSHTFTTYMLSKNFAYDFIQFGGKAVKSTADSDEIKRTILKKMPFNTSLLGFYPPDKLVSWLVDIYSEGTDQKSINARTLVKSIEDYFINNQEVFFNMGGDRIISHIQKNKIKVTRIEVTEIWRKMPDGISYETKSMTIFVNDSTLNSMSPRAIADADIVIEEKLLKEIISEKNFGLIVTKINSQVIKRKDAYLYLKGLMTAEWNQVISYVVNY